MLQACHDRSTCSCSEESFEPHSAERYVGAGTQATLPTPPEHSLTVEFTPLRLLDILIDAKYTLSPLTSPALLKRSPRPAPAIHRCWFLEHINHVGAHLYSTRHCEE